MRVRDARPDEVTPSKGVATPARKKWSTKLEHPSYSIEQCPACGFPEADGGYCPDCGWSRPDPRDR